MINHILQNKVLHFIYHQYFPVFFSSSPDSGEQVYAIHLRGLASVFIVSLIVLYFVFLIFWNFHLRRRSKRSTEALQESEKKYRSIFENAVEGIFQILPDGSILAANNAFAELLGYTTAAEVLADKVNVSQRYTDESTRDVLLQQLVKQGVVRNFETAIVRNDKSVIFVSINAYAVRDKHHNLLYIEGISTDITQRKEAEETLRTAKEDLEVRVKERTKELSETNLSLTQEIKVRRQAEEELRDREERLRAIFSNASAGVAIVDANGRYLQVNSTWATMLAYTENELLQMEHVTTLHPEGREDSRANMEQILRTGQSAYTRTERRFIRKDGTIFWASLSPSAFRNKEGEVIGIVGVFTDITDLKQAERALSRSERRLRQLIETMNEGFTVLDKDGKITYCNPKLIEMFGHELKDVIGQSPAIFLDDKNAKLLFKQFSERKQGVSRQYEIEWIRKDGSRFPAIVSPKPIVDHRGNFNGSVAIITDISEQKEYQNQLQEKNEELNSSNEELRATLEKLRSAQQQLVQQEKMASLGQLTAGVAHEINNPINFVSGNVSPLKMDISDIQSAYERFKILLDERPTIEKINELKDYLEKIEIDFLFEEIDILIKGIEEGALRTKEIVAGLKNFSRLDESDMKLADVNQGIESTLLILRNKLKNKIEVEKDLGDLPEIICFPGKLNQVFMNILNNAADAIDEQGTIYIRTWKIGDNIKIAIRDTGKGIPESLKQRIFEPFFTTKDVGKGTGLGLSITYGIVERHDGTIEVNSELGKGTEFIITLPAHQDMSD